MAANITIRPAVKNDAHAIAELYQIAGDGVTDYLWQSVADQYPGLSGLEIGVVCYAQENELFSYENTLMAERDGTVAGMLMGFAVGGDSDPLPDDFDPVMRPYMELMEPESFYVAGLGVYEEARNQGIGTALIARAEQCARDQDCPSLSLSVFEANEGAMRLYQRLGFREMDRRTAVPHPIIHVTGDVLLMVRPL